jgi:hypothetical protein
MEDGEEAEDSKRRSPCCNRNLRSVLNPSLSPSLLQQGHGLNSKNPRKTTQHLIPLPPPPSSPAVAPPPYLSRATEKAMGAVRLQLLLSKNTLATLSRSCSFSSSQSSRPFVGSFADGFYNSSSSDATTTTNQSSWRTPPSSFQLEQPGGGGGGGKGGMGVSRWRTEEECGKCFLS